MTDPAAGSADPEDLGLADRVAALERRTGPVGGLETRIARLERSLLRTRLAPDELAAVEESLQAAIDLIRLHVPPRESVGVLSGHDPELLATAGLPIVPLGLPHRVEPVADAGLVASAMAMLTAARSRGLRYALLAPEALGNSSGRYLRERLVDHFELVSEDHAAGTLLELSPEGVAAREPAEAPSLAQTLDRVAGSDRDAPILDWTGLGLASLLDGRTVFTKPQSDDPALPYLDGSVAVVVIDDPARIDEARRVAAVATIGVRGQESGRLDVVDVDELGGPAEDESVEVIIAAGRDSTDSARHAEQASVHRPDIPLRHAADPVSAAADSEADIVVILGPGVLPLPGCHAALAATLAREGGAAAAAKLIGPSGTLEGAGTMVFSDGSAAGVGAGCPDLAAAWHEYARPVCAGEGLLAVRPEAVETTGGGPRSLLGLAAELWRAGLEVRYQPDAWAVRAWPAADGWGNGADAAADAAERWAQALPSRPHRPVELDAGAWWSLLACEDVEASWR